MAARKKIGTKAKPRLNDYDEEFLNFVHYEKINRKAKEDGPDVKKHWSIHDLKTLKPLNDKQASLIESYFTGNNIIASGSAGTR